MLVFSQSCSAFVCVVSRRLLIIVVDVVLKLGHFTARFDLN